MSDDFKFGPSWSGETCCGKPVGCTNIGEGCVARRHPWKQANVEGWAEAVGEADRPEKEQQ